MNVEKQLDLALRKSLGPAPASAEFKAGLGAIPAKARRAHREGKNGPALWRFSFGLGLAGAFCVFALGLWLGGLAGAPENDGLILLTSSDIDYLEAFL
jgi:hypothetical protein